MRIQNRACNGGRARRLAAGSQLRPCGVRTGDRVSLLLPLTHGHGIATVVLGLVLGTTTTIHARPDIAVWRSLQAQQTDVLVLVPTLLGRLLAAVPTRRPRLAHRLGCATATRTLRPKWVTVVPGLPCTHTGKVRRADLSSMSERPR